MPAPPLKMSDLAVAVSVLRSADGDGVGAFATTARSLGIPKTNLVDGFDRVEAHFGKRLIEARGTKDSRRDGGLTPAGRSLLKHGAGLLWLYDELVKDLAALRDAPTEP